MPELVAAAMAWAGTLSAASLFQIAFTVAMAAYSSYQQAEQRQAAKDAFNNAQRDRLVMIGGAIDPRQIVMGRIRKSGSMVYRGSFGANKEKLLLVIVLAGHEIDAVETIYFNDVVVGLDANGYATTTPYALASSQSASDTVTIVGGFGTVTLSNTPIVNTIFGGVMSPGAPAADQSTPIVVLSVVGNVVHVSCAVDGVAALSYQASVSTPKARIRSYLGAPGQVADARLISLLPGIWTTAHTLTGCAYLIVELDYDSDVYSQGLPNISATVRGAKCYDPRSGLTAWTQNPALIARWYAMHPLGGNLGASLMSDAHVIVAANNCDVNASYAVQGAVVSTRPIYQAGTVATSGQKASDVLNEIVGAMAGKWAFVGNQFLMKSGTYVTPTISLGDADFGDAASITVQARLPREQMINTMTGTFSDESQSYKVVDFPPVQSAPYFAEDGAELSLNAQLTAVTYTGQAQQVAAIMIRDTRWAMTVVAPFRMTAYPIEVFDTVMLSSTRYGWVAKPFEVLGRKWTLDGLIELTLKETDPSIFTFGTAFLATDATLNTNLPLPWLVPQITGLAVTSGTVALTDKSVVTRTRVTWTPITLEAVAQSGKIEIAYSELGTDAWSTDEEAGDASETTITGLKSGRMYLFKVRARNTVGVRGMWSLQFGTIIASPPAVGGSTDVALVARGQCILNGNAATKVGGVLAWDSDVYSLDRIGGGAFASATAVDTAHRVMFALGSAPTLDSSYASLDYAFYLSVGGDLQIFERSSSVLGGMTYAAGDVFFITYDGVSVRYLQNGILRRSVPSATGTIFAWDSSFYDPGASLRGIRFGPLADMSGVIASVAALNAALAVIANDNVLSRGEKSAVILDWSTIYNESDAIAAQAFAYGLLTQRTAYIAALTALQGYLNGLYVAGPVPPGVPAWNDLTQDTPIVGATFRTKFADLYAARQMVLAAIADYAATHIIGTGQIAPGAVSDPTSVFGGNGVFASPANSDTSVTVRALNWINPLAVAVATQIDVSVLSCTRISWTGAPPLVTMTINFSTAAGSSSYVLGNFVGDGAQLPPNSLSATGLLVSVPANGTLVVSFVLRAVASSAATSTWSSSFLRITPLKR